MTGKHSFLDSLPSRHKKNLNRSHNGNKERTNAPRKVAGQNTEDGTLRGLANTISKSTSDMKIGHEHERIENPLFDEHHDDETTTCSSFDNEQMHEIRVDETASCDTLPAPSKCPTQELSQVYSSPGVTGLQNSRRVTDHCGSSHSLSRSNHRKGLKVIDDNSSAIIQASSNIQAILEELVKSETCSLHQKITQLQNQMETQSQLIHSEADKYLTTIQDVEGQLESTKSDLRGLERSLVSAQNENRLLATQNQKLRDELTQRESMHKTEIARLERVLEEANFKLQTSSVSSNPLLIHDSTDHMEGRNKPLIYYDDDGNEGVRVPETLLYDATDSIENIRSSIDELLSKRRVRETNNDYLPSTHLLSSRFHSTHRDEALSLAKEGNLILNLLSSSKNNQDIISPENSSISSSQSSCLLSPGKEKQPQGNPDTSNARPMKAAFDLDDHPKDTKISCVNDQMEVSKYHSSRNRTQTFRGRGDTDSKRKVTTSDNAKSFIIPEKNVSNSLEERETTGINPPDKKQRSMAQVPEPKYRYQDVVRSRKERELMNGHTCEQCSSFINAVCDSVGGSVFDKKHMISNCSRHRSKFSPPTTPEGFWELSFPDEKSNVRY